MKPIPEKLRLSAEIQEKSVKIPTKL